MESYFPKLVAAVGFTKVLNFLRILTTYLPVRKRKELVFQCCEIRISEVINDIHRNEPLDGVTCRMTPERTRFVAIHSLNIMFSLPSDTKQKF